MDKFRNNAKDVVWHIPSKYSKEMSQKSEVVSYHTPCIAMYIAPCACSIMQLIGALFSIASHITFS